VLIKVDLHLSLAFGYRFGIELFRDNLNGNEQGRKSWNMCGCEGCLRKEKAIKGELKK